MKYSYEKALVLETDLSTSIASLASYRKELQNIAEQKDYAVPESSLQLARDEHLLKHVQTVAKRLHSPTLQYVIVIGIGGSNLGTQAVYEAIAGSMNLLVDRLPKLIFLDTVTDEKMTAVTRILEHLTIREDFLVIVISKSGTTTETIANLEVLWAYVKDQFGNPSDRFVFITEEGSKLWETAGQKKIERLEIPKQINGRFSVFSAVGLLPLALSGIDIENLLDGAKKAIMDGISDNLAKNHSITNAAVTYLKTRSGRPIHNTFLFSPKLEGLGKWYRQLMAESLGKNKDLNGKDVHAGITPIVSIGSTDLHSMAQLYWEGPDDKLTNMIFSFTGEIHATPQHLAFPGLVLDIQETSLESIMQAIFGGVKAAYEQQNRPYVEIDLEQADAWELGYYVQFRMIEMMYLGRLLNLNTFNQPAVEMYKTVTRKLLKGL